MDTYGYIYLLMLDILIKQPQSLSEILYGIFKLTYAHTDLLNFM